MAFMLLMLIAALVISGCVRQVAPLPVNDGSGSSQFEDILTATPIPPTPTITDTPEATEEPTPTDTPEAPAPTEPPAPTSTIHIITPTHTAAPTEEAAPTQEGTPAPTNAPTPQPTSSVPQINPDLMFTGAHHVDTMDEVTMWTDASGVLPDSQYIKLEMDEGQMSVTGKLRLWDTWWISGFTLTDFYVEMDVNTGNCNPDDAYGMILRASQHGEPTHGYLIGFTCAGEVFARRLQSVSPYVSISILNPTETDLVYAGANQDNTFGVLMEDNKITIYPNRRFFTTIADDGFAWGRYGVYVSAGDAGNYTYTVKEIRTWGVGE